jgi:hypothetical protein
MKVDQLTLVPFWFPIYANSLGRVALTAARQLDMPAGAVADPLADDVVA